MIYDYPDQTVPIRQGDVFFGVPRVELSLENVLVINQDDSTDHCNWNQVPFQNNEATLILPVKKVIGIVASQDCDCSRHESITFCEVREFKTVEGKAASAKSAKSFRSIITQQARLNQKWFYLPVDPKIGFNEKMGVDFSVTFQVPRRDLEKQIHLRRGRLNAVADEHFRERIAEFYRRYPYDEWYPLDKDEFASYQDNYPEAPPFSWQRPDDQVGNGKLA